MLEPRRSRGGRRHGCTRQASSTWPRRPSRRWCRSSAERGDDAKVMAGGQSLIPLMKLRFAAPGAVIDLNGVGGLDTLADGGGRCADRRARPPPRLRALRAPPRPLPTARRCGAPRGRPDRPEPRHRLRLARARRPAGRLGLGHARGARRGRRKGARRRAHDRHRRSHHGPVHDEPRAGRGDHRGPRSRSRGRGRAAPT